MPQEALLFHRTIAENIAYGNPRATMAQIEQAAEKANIAAFIETLDVAEAVKEELRALSPSTYTGIFR